MQTSVVNYPCLACKKEVIYDAIECSLCKTWVHRQCAKISKKELKKFASPDCNWYCFSCKDVFPYTNIWDEEFNFLI